MVTAITKFISGLSDFGKKLFVGALILIIITLFDRLLIAPTMSRLSTIDDEIAREKDSIKGDMHFLAYEDKILKESKEVDPYLVHSFPPEREIGDALLKKIEMLAVKANVTLAKEAQPTGQQEKDYLKYSTDFECTGKLTDVVTLMHLINSSGELMKVVKFNLSSKKSDSDDIKATMTVSKIIVSKEALLPANPAPSNAKADVANTKTN